MTSPLPQRSQVRCWCLQPTASWDGTEPSPEGAARCTVGERAARLLAGACRGREEDLEESVSLLLPASRTFSGDWDSPCLPPTSSPGSTWCQRPP